MQRTEKKEKDMFEFVQGISIHKRKDETLTIGKENEKYYRQPLMESY